MTALYFFNWPSHVGGADTKLVHLLPLLAGCHRITVVPNTADRLREKEWTDWLAALGIAFCLVDDLPVRCEGWAVSLCNGAFFEQAIQAKARARGLKVAWSNEMMWHFPAELGAICMGRVDTVLYTSAAQRRVLEPGYRDALFCTEDCPVAGDEARSGVLTGPVGGRLRWVETGNYVDPAQFPFRQRGLEGGSGPLVIGRVSRPDPDKFPPDFPGSYEGLGLGEDVRFRVLGWSAQMAALWPEHEFDGRWELLPVNSVPVAGFLGTLDVFVYELGPRFSESWGRAVVEAMLSGVVPVVPADERHHLHRLVPHGEAGFLCADREDFGRHVRALACDPALLARMSAAARRHAEQVLCRAEDHLAVWREVFR